jgi:hypothetical protein
MCRKIEKLKPLPLMMNDHDVFLHAGKDGEAKWQSQPCTLSLLMVLTLPIWYPHCSPLSSSQPA